MSLLDDVIGRVLGGAGASSGFQNVLMNILGGGQGSGQGGLLGGGQGGMMPQQQGGGLGGLGGLLSTLRNGGLGHAAQSWVDPGPNQPVSPDQLRNALGEDRTTTMANQAGMDEGSFLNQLSQHLPSVVDGMTPNGRVPDEGTVSV
jgi:uncharacterized protein YidB (DUF937 family)